MRCATKPSGSRSIIPVELGIGDFQHLAGLSVVPKTSFRSCDVVCLIAIGCVTHYQLTSEFGVNLALVEAQSGIQLQQRSISPISHEGMVILTA